MFKCIRALSVAGLATIGSSQAGWSAQQNVLWSPDKERAEVMAAGIQDAARAISRADHLHPLVRFTANGVGGTALVPLWPYAEGGRCSPDFDPTPFRAEKGREIWAHFEFVNIQPTDRDLIALAVKADKPGCKDRFRTDHDIGNSRRGNKASMTALLAPPAEGDYGYYFVERGILKTDEILDRNPGAAMRVTISNHAPGRAV